MYWFSTALRVLNLDESVAFYEKHFGMVVVSRDSKGVLLATPGGLSKEPLRCLFLVQAPLTLKKINNGNEEPHRGFGHIAFNTNHVEAACEGLEAQGVSFRKKPNEGRMKGLAFALDPNGYWIEIVARKDPLCGARAYNLSQTMIRIKDPNKSLPFYQKICNLELSHTMPMSDFTNYFLSPQGEEVYDGVKREVFNRWWPILELTHNHGTENDKTFAYHTGNTEPMGFIGLGFKGDFPPADQIEALGGKLLEPGVIQDPDGYRIFSV